MVVYFRLMNLLCFIIQIMVNSGWFNLRNDPKLLEVWKEHHSILVPSGYAFMVWAFIYLFLLIFIIYQLLPFTYHLKYINDAITPYFYIQCICNSCWVLITNLTSVTEYEQYKPLRLIFIFGLLVSLYIPYQRTLTIVKEDIINRTDSAKNLYINYWFGRVWLSFYFVWVLFASAMDLFSCLNLAPSHLSYLFASLVVYMHGGYIVHLVHYQSDVVAGLTYAFILSALTNKNYPYNNPQDQSGPQFQLYIASFLVMVAVLLTSLASLNANIKFCLARYGAGYHNIHFNQSEAQSILANPQNQ